MPISANHEVRLTSTEGMIVHGTPIQCLPSLAQTRAVS
jgi:hypothetical protein